MRFVFATIFTFFTCMVFSQENLNHTVQKGETLYSISKKYKVSVAQLETLNPEAKNGLAINSKLKISERNESEITEHKVAPKETLYGLSKKYNISIEKLKQLNPIIESEGLEIGMVLKLSNDYKSSNSGNSIVQNPKPKPVENEESQEVFHTVLPKETKYRISKKYKIKIAELERLNPQIKDGLEVGMQLVIKTSQRNENQVTTPNIIKPVSIESLSKAEAVIATASSNIGTKYRSGGTDADGFDCSGLMVSSFKSIDIALPRTSSEQADFGVKIDKNLAQKGDLIFFATNGSSISHVGLITEISDNDIKFVHSSTSSGVIISSITEEYYEKRFVQINRVIP